MKKLILALILIISTTQAQSVLSKMPYSMKFGKPVPKKVLKRSSYNEEYKYYILEDKFKFSSNNKLLDSIVFRNEYYNDNKKTHKLPKSWKELGLRICTASTDGTSFDDFQRIIKNQEGVKLYKHTVYNNWDLVELEIDEKYRYKFNFAIKDSKTILKCKTGLYKIEITGDVLNEDY